MSVLTFGSNSSSVGLSLVVSNLLFSLAIEFLLLLTMSVGFPLIYPRPLLSSGSPADIPKLLLYRFPLHLKAESSYDAFH